jgi:hypothetical protein
MVVRESRMEKNVTVRNAVEDALGILGDASKAALLYHLADKYRISLDSCTMAEVKAALKEMLGEGASIITAVIDKRYRA